MDQPHAEELLLDNHDYDELWETFALFCHFLQQNFYFLFGLNSLQFASISGEKMLKTFIGSNKTFLCNQNIVKWKKDDNYWFDT